MATTVFRVEKKDNFTIISNRHLQDSTLSNKAKGLLTIMLSLPPTWDMTLKGLVSLSSDGVDAIRSTIAELEQHGYLSRTRERNALGQMQCTEYTIHEEPVQLTEGKRETSHSKSEQEPSIAPEAEEISGQNADVTGISSQMGKSDVAQMGKSDVDKSAESDAEKNGLIQIGFPNIGKPYVGKADPIKDLNNKNTDGIKYSPSHPYHLDSSKQDAHRIDGIEKAAKLQKERTEYESLLKDNIDYDDLMENPDVEFCEYVKLALDVMLDTVTTTTPLLRVKGQDFPAETVKSWLLRLTSQQIIYVWESLQNSNRKIANIQSYLLTALYNSLTGEDLYYGQWVKQDLSRVAGQDA